MCRFASFVLTKDRELWLPDSDSHSDIIARYDLHEDGARGPNILRVEITPGADLKRWEDYGDWGYRIDQDQMPEWFNGQSDEKRARLALLRRAKDGFATVDARGCAALTKLELPAAKTVYVSGCAALTKLELPAATWVEARGCAALTKLELPAAKTVDVSGCAALTGKWRHK